VEVTARVDDSREFMSEGLEWGITKRGEYSFNHIDRSTVIAWYEK